MHLYTPGLGFQRKDVLCRIGKGKEGNVMWLKRKVAKVEDAATI
jgi:hypothetical protein